MSHDPYYLLADLSDFRTKLDDIIECLENNKELDDVQQAIIDALPL